MEEKTLKYGHIGCPVIIEVIDAKDPSLCRFGYKIGDTWEVNIWDNAGLCGLAYNSFFPDINMFQANGAVPYKTSEQDRVTRSCPDIRPGYRFLIRKKQ